MNPGTEGMLRAFLFAAVQTLHHLRGCGDLARQQGTGNPHPLRLAVGPDVRTNPAPRLESCPCPSPSDICVGRSVQICGWDDCDGMSRDDQNCGQDPPVWTACLQVDIHIDVAAVTAIFNGVRKCQIRCLLTTASAAAKSWNRCCVIERTLFPFALTCISCCLRIISSVCLTCTICTAGKEHHSLQMPTQCMLCKALGRRIKPHVLHIGVSLRGRLLFIIHARCASGTP